MINFIGMNGRKIIGSMALIFAMSFSGLSQEVNPNLISSGNHATIDASSTFSSPAWMAPPSNISDERLQLRWEADQEKEGAWNKIKWNEPQKIKELWIVNKATPYDFLLDRLAFNSPFTVYSGKGETEGSAIHLPISISLISISPSNIIASALKQGEDGTGIFLRFYEAEGRYTKAKIMGFQAFSKVYLTDMLENNPEEIKVQSDGSIDISVKPWEIINLKIEK